MSSKLSKNQRRRRNAQAKQSNAVVGFNGNLQATVLTNMPLFPHSVRKRLTYSTNFSVTGTSGAAGAYVFSANGPFDPDITGTGHQPMGFDQMMLYYEHYIGISAKINVWALNLNSTLGCCVGISINASTSVVTSASTLVENGNLVWEMLSISTGALNCKQLMASVNVGKFEGIDDVKDQSDLRGDTASNPAEQVYFHVCAWAADGSSTIGPTFQAVIEYDVWFVEPRKITPSLRAKSEAPDFVTVKKCDCKCVP